MQRDRSVAEENEGGELTLTRDSLEDEEEVRSSLRESKRWRRNPDMQHTVAKVHADDPIRLKLSVVHIPKNGSGYQGTRRLEFWILAVPQPHPCSPLGLHFKFWGKFERKMRQDLLFIDLTLKSSGSETTRSWSMC